MESCMMFHIILLKSSIIHCNTITFIIAFSISVYEIVKIFFYKMINDIYV